MINIKFQHKCPICGKFCLDKTELDIHMKQFHDLSIEQQIQMQTVKKQLKHPTLEFNKLNINLNRHVFIEGQTGSGKSVIGKFIFATLSKKDSAIFVDIKHDPANEEFIKHFPIFTDLAEIKKHFESSKGFFGKSKDMRIVYRPKRVKSESTKTHTLDNPNWRMFQDLCNWCYEKGNIVLFVDEAALFSTPQNIVPAAYEIMILGRSRGVIMVNISQRPSSIHNCLISEAYTRFLLRTELESDRLKLKGIVGVEVTDQLHKLPDEIFIISYINGKWEKGHLNIPKKYKWIIS